MDIAAWKITEGGRAPRTSKIVTEGNERGRRTAEERGEKKAIGGGLDGDREG